MNVRLMIIGLLIIILTGVVYAVVVMKSRQDKTAGYVPLPKVYVTPGPPDSTEVSGYSQYKYVEYTADALNQPTRAKRVLFFHASWCPTCKGANEEFEKNASAIPEDVVVYKTDYDANTELKKKYGITYQHTFVLVDEEGNAVKKWNGGGISELVKQMKQ